MVALPASVPAAAVGHAVRVAATDGSVGVFLGGFDADPGQPPVEPVVGEARVARGAVAELGTPREALGVGVLALPPPAVG